VTSSNLNISLGFGSREKFHGARCGEHRGWGTSQVVSGQKFIHIQNSEKERCHSGKTNPQCSVSQDVFSVLISIEAAECV